MSPLHHGIADEFWISHRHERPVWFCYHFTVPHAGASGRRVVEKGPVIKCKRTRILAVRVAHQHPCT
jgi:hypothetical protein